MSFAYDTEPVLRDVSLTIGARQVTVLKGLSGSGKTTLIDLLVGLHRPQKGKVLLGVTPLDDMDIAACASASAMCRRISRCFTPPSVRTSAWGFSITDDQLEEAVRLAGLEGFIATLPGVSTPVWAKWAPDYRADSASASRSPGRW